MDLSICLAVTHRKFLLLLYAWFVLMIHFSHLDCKYLESGLSFNSTYIQ